MFGAPWQYSPPNFQVPTSFNQVPYHVQTGEDFQGIYTVSGIEGARGHFVPVGARVVLMDRDDARFWVKAVDTFGAISMQEYKFKEVVTKDTSQNFVPLEDFEALQKEFEELRSMYESNIRESEPESVTVIAEPIVEEW